MNNEGYFREQKRRFDDFVARTVLRRWENRNPEEQKEEESLRIATEAILLFANAERQEPLASFEDPNIFDFKNYKQGAIFRTRSKSTSKLDLLFQPFNRYLKSLIRPPQDIYCWYVLGKIDEEGEENSRFSLYQVCHGDSKDIVRGNQLKIGQSLFLSKMNIKTTEFLPSEWNAVTTDYTTRDELFGKIETIDIMSAGKTSRVNEPELERGLRRFAPAPGMS